ncbi:MAG: 6-bladed beta-propeller [Rubrivivax sp.]
MLQSLGLALAGCAGTPEAPSSRASVPLWPPPPELPRYRYEATLRDASSVRDESEAAQMRRRVTGEDERLRGFGKPFAVAARAGRVYVTDTEGRRVFVFDLPRRRTFSFGFRFEGELKKPAGLAIDGQGRVYVVDATARRVIVYDELGLYVGSIEGQRDWVRPTAVAVRPDGAQLAVVDTGGVDSGSHRLWFYGEQGRPDGQLGRRGSAPGEFNLPADACYGPDGRLWVLDAGNFRVQAFDAQRRFAGQFGSVGNGIGQFARPRGLAVDGDGHVYVSDAMFCNVQVFDPEGRLLLTLGARASSDAPGRYLLPAKLAVDEGRFVYVVDQFLHKVEVLRRLTDAEGRALLAPSAG